MKGEKRLGKRVVKKTDGRYLIYFERKPAGPEAPARHAGKNRR